MLILLYECKFGLVCLVKINKCASSAHPLDVAPQCARYPKIVWLLTMLPKQIWRIFDAKDDKEPSSRPPQVIAIPQRRFAITLLCLLLFFRQELVRNDPSSKCMRRKIVNPFHRVRHILPARQKLCGREGRPRVCMPEKGEHFRKELAAVPC